MAAGSTGVSKYHWYGMIVPLLAAISPMWLSRLRLGLPQPLAAVVCGAIVAALAFVVFQFGGPFRETSALGKAVLLGVLVTETLVFHARTQFPSMTALTLFLFLYFNIIEFSHAGPRD